MRIAVAHVAGADATLPLPRYATAGAAGADVCANFPDRKTIPLAPGARVAVPTGLRFGIPPGVEVQVRPRSGLALKHGVTVANAPGTIDADYRGEVRVLLVNLGTEPVEIAHGMRIAQLVAAPVLRADFAPGEPDDTARGAGGFGSTGIDP
ncbi:dUTP diphosphatase [Salipiger sp. IMCC34102]|uniref:dUTP diphosphatase n=1 Tax=Salipiger sp. IMCC34102 TaxID=2510647 RepID=UPI00101CF6CD|nr:dUTP diphosphatase [Salipiger sp. IMCC34102]RYH01417.1 dUTP diphosphatase [Salipiger sp. IMCC34102]